MAAWPASRSAAMPGSSQAKNAVALPMPVHQPAEPSARLSSSTTSTRVAGSTSRPPSDSGRAMVNTPAALASATRSAGSVVSRSLSLAWLENRSASTETRSTSAAAGVLVVVTSTWSQVVKDRIGRLDNEYPTISILTLGAVRVVGRLTALRPRRGAVGGLGADTVAAPGDPGLAGAPRSARPENVFGPVIVHCGPADFPVWKVSRRHRMSTPDYSGQARARPPARVTTRCGWLTRRGGTPRLADVTARRIQFDISNKSRWSRDRPSRDGTVILGVLTE